MGTETGVSNRRPRPLRAVAWTPPWPGCHGQAACIRVAWPCCCGARASRQCGADAAPVLCGMAWCVLRGRRWVRGRPAVRGAGWWGTDAAEELGLGAADGLHEEAAVVRHEELLPALAPCLRAMCGMVSRTRDLDAPSCSAAVVSRTRAALITSLAPCRAAPSWSAEHAT